MRALLDDSGLTEVSIVASGNLDEHAIASLLRERAPIDGFGVGSRLGVSSDAPYLEVAYKLVSFAGRPVMKLSPGKETLPGAKQVWRRVEGERFAGDLIALRNEPGPRGALPMLVPVMAQGRRLGSESLEAARERARAQRAALGAGQRRLDADRLPRRAQPRPRALEARLAEGARPAGASRERGSRATGGGLTRRGTLRRSAKFRPREHRGARFRKVRAT